jgi:hypothetical protein
MDRRTGRNMQNFITKYICEIGASIWVYYKEICYDARSHERKIQSTVTWYRRKFFSDFTLMRPKVNATGHLIIESRSNHCIKRKHKTNQQPHVTLFTIVEKTNTHLYLLLPKQAV